MFNVAANLKPIDIDPLQDQIHAVTLRQLREQGPLQMEHLRQQTALGSEQTKAAQAANAQTAIDARDQQTIQQAQAAMLASGANPFDHEELMKGIAGKVQPKTLTIIQKQALDHQKELSAQSKEQLDQGKAHTSAIAEAAGALQSLDPGQRAAQWPAVRQSLIAGKHAGEQDLPTDAPDDQWLQVHKLMAVAADKQIDQANTARLTAAELPGKQADSDLKVRQGDATKLANAPTKEAYAAILDAMPHGRAVQFPSADTWDKNTPNTVLRLGMTPEQQSQAVNQERTNARLALPNTAAEFARIKNDPKSSPEDRKIATASLKDLEAHQKAGASAQSIQLSQEAIDMLARNVAAGAPMPSLGRNAGGAIGQVLNKAAGAQPDLNMAGAKADYKANSASLTKLQTQRDGVVSFEKTALRNLDQFLGTAKNVVDTGSPLLNTPVRMVTGAMGGTDQAAFDAARTVALTEIAKVVSSPGLSGALSDSARHEVEALNPKNATLKQIYAVAQVLKNDMHNRHTELDASIADIKGRIGSNGQPAAAPPAASSNAPKKPLSEIFK